MPSCYAKLAVREPRQLLNCARRNFPLSAVAKLDHRLLTPAKLIHLASKRSAIYEQRMHAGRQVRSVTLPPESRQFFFILSGKAADQGKMWTRARVGSVAENAGM